MKIEKYERPSLEEIEIEIEGSFLTSATYSRPNEGKYDGDEEDPWA